MNISNTVRSRCLEFKIDLNLKDTKTIVDNYYNEKIYDNIIKILKNY